MFSYCLSEPEAGSDAAAMKTRAVRDGDDWVLNGVKRWITNAGVSEYYTVFAVTDPDSGARGISAFVVEKSDDGVSFGAQEKKLGIKGSPDPRGLPRQRPHPRRPDDRRGGHRLHDRDAHPRPHPARRSPRRPSASPRAPLDYALALRQGAQAVRQADRGLPGPAVHARRHGDEDRGRAAAHLRRRRPLRAQRRRPDFMSARREVLRVRHGDGGHDQRACSCSAATATRATTRSSA